MGVRSAGGQSPVHDRHAEVQTTWGIYQRMLAAYPANSQAEDKKIMIRLIKAIGTAIPNSLVEITKLGRTLTKRRDDVLAFFDHTGSSNGPTETINGQLEHLHGTALSFRNRVNYRLRCLLIPEGFDT